VAGLSDIEWTDATWNPLSGCVMVSPGCTNCYAMRMATRLQAIGHPAYRAVTRKSGGRPIWTGRLRLNEHALDVPLRWRKPKKIFVNSMSDLFQTGVRDEFIVAVWNVMQQAEWHTFQVLTKRPENMTRLVAEQQLPVLPNVWLGTSVESSDYNYRIDFLRSVPAAIRFISFEPLIGEISDVNLSGIHWAIVGGESGPRSRPMNPDWVEEIRMQCKQQKVAFFFKQWGGANKSASGRHYLGKTWDDFPLVDQPAV
jgi:protein gp37